VIRFGLDAHYSSGTGQSAPGSSACSPDVTSRSAPGTPFRRAAVWFLQVIALLLASAAAAKAAAYPDVGAIRAAPLAPASAVNTVSPAEYQARLQSLDQLIASCQRAMTPANCRRDQVGPDLQYALPTGSRRIRLSWLRELLDRAARDQSLKGQADKSAATGATPAIPMPAKLMPEFTPPTISEQLADARKRLAADARLARAMPANLPANPSPQTNPQRQILDRILAAREYHAAVAQPSLMSRLLEKVGNWLDRIIAKLQQIGFQSRWIGLSAEIGFILMVCVALAWLLIRIERQGRLISTMIRPEAPPGAASARDWQLWLHDARKAAAHGNWRDAIHLTYWASISRLESDGQWPADRARTPREYLALLSPQSSQRSSLTTLTRSFERTWYAGCPAEEADFRQAEQLAAELGAKSKDFPGVK
jgi:hypothetical protein